MLSFNRLRDKKIIASTRRGWRKWRKSATRIPDIMYLTDTAKVTPTLIDQFIGTRETATAGKLARAGLTDSDQSGRD